MSERRRQRLRRIVDDLIHAQEKLGITAALVQTTEASPLLEIAAEAAQAAADYTNQAIRALESSHD